MKSIDLSGIAADSEHIRATLARIEKSFGSRNTQAIRIEGAGIGAVIGGFVLGASVACMAWVAWALADMREDQRQDDAFIQATYQAVPYMREKFDSINAEQSGEKK